MRPWNELAGLVLYERIVLIDSEARTGTVLFSTTILKPLVTCAIRLAHASTYLRSAARPLPTPYVFVGVFTDINIRSAL